MASLDSEAFVYKRSFAAPPELVFHAFTEAAHLAHWWGPPGCTIDVLEHEAAPGGRFHYAMRFPAGTPAGTAMDWHGLFEYRELSPFERIVFVNGFADQQGRRVHHPLMPTWPLEMLITVTLQESGGQTHMDLHMVPLNARPLERQTFIAGNPSMQQGFGATFDKLAAHLAALN